MAEHQVIDVAGAEPAEESNALATLANIEEMAEQRDRAVEEWIAFYDRFHDDLTRMAMICIGGGISLSPGHGSSASEKNCSALFATQPRTRHDRETGRRTELTAREDWARRVTNELDRQCWTALLARTNMESLMDAQARAEFRTSLETDPPAFTAAAARATFGHLWANRREIYLRGIANVFMKMDRRFRSHDAFAIGNRLIIENAFYASDYLSSQHWNSYEKRDRLHDVERVFRELDGQPPHEWGAGICKVLEDMRPGRVECDYFKADKFKNGNLHLWFTNKALLKQVNALLLEYYKPMEGDVAEDGPSYRQGPSPHRPPAKYYGEYFSSPEVAAAVVERSEVRPERYDQDARQYVPWTPRVLEPSAGSGVLARAMRDKGADVVCVEIQEHLAQGLRGQGFDTRHADFLRLQPEAIGLFDYVVMNPPFDRGRDVDHVVHAMRFLKPGGQLVTVMSARAQFCEDARHQPLRDLVKQTGETDWWCWRDLPERSFAHAGTNVNTVTLRLRKPWK